MFIADSQIHLWRERPEVTPENAHQRHDRVFAKDEALREMDGAGVARAVVLLPWWETNEYGLEVAHELPDKFAVFGRMELDAPEVRDQLSNWKASGMLGVRLVPRPQQAQWLADGHADWIWAQAERARLPIMIWSPAPGWLPLVEDVAKRHPDLKITIDHLGLARHARGEGALDHIPYMATLSQYPNVSVKASGLPAHSSEAYPFKDLDEPIRRIVDSFGPRRVFWGTDLTRMPISYRQCVTHFTELTWLAEADKRLIMGRALCDWMGWTVPAQQR